mmetsp:Transcript_149620/g.480250  ORF Transcript_149620/g.480250 Transcript_149620/m.480250 type:complete len:405 (-) Transcript_149620:5781-6995(-)
MFLGSARTRRRRRPRRGHRVAGAVAGAIDLHGRRPAQLHVGCHRSFAPVRRRRVLLLRLRGRTLRGRAGRQWHRGRGLPLLESRGLGLGLGPEWTDVALEADGAGEVAEVAFDVLHARIGSGGARGGRRRRRGGRRPAVLASAAAARPEELALVRAEGHGEVSEGLQHRVVVRLVLWLVLLVMLVMLLLLVLLMLLLRVLLLVLRLLRVLRMPILCAVVVLLPSIGRAERGARPMLSRRRPIRIGVLRGEDVNGPFDFPATSPLEAWVSTSAAAAAVGPAGTLAGPCTTCCSNPEGSECFFRIPELLAGVPRLVVQQLVVAVHLLKFARLASHLDSQLPLRTLRGCQALLHLLHLRVTLLDGIDRFARVGIAISGLIHLVAKAANLLLQLRDDNVLLAAVLPEL